MPGGTIRLYYEDGVTKYRHNDTVQTVGGVTPSDISTAVETYLSENPITPSWSGITGKPETFPPDAHLHANYADSTHVHDYAPTIHAHDYSASNHGHLGVYSPIDHTHPASGGDGEVSVCLTDNRTTNSTSYVDVTGLTFTADANSTYIIEAYLVFQSNNITYGIGYSINGPASPSYCVGHVDIMLAANTRTLQNIIAYNNSNVTSASVVAINTNYPAFLWCNLKTGANGGAVTIRHRSENASGTVMTVAGSTLRYRKVA